MTNRTKSTSGRKYLLRAAIVGAGAAITGCSDNTSQPAPPGFSVQDAGTTVEDASGIAVQDATVEDSGLSIEDAGISIGDAMVGVAPLDAGSDANDAAPGDAAADG